MVGRLNLVTSHYFSDSGDVEDLDIKAEGC